MEVKRSDEHAKSLTFSTAASKTESLTESREDQVFPLQFYYSHGDIWDMSLTVAASDSLSCLIQRPRNMAVSKAERDPSTSNRINPHAKTTWALLGCMEINRGGIYNILNLKVSVEWHWPHLPNCMF